MMGEREFRIRANLNGGELNGEGLEYPKGVSDYQRSAYVPDRPK